MRLTASNPNLRAERRAAPKPARIPRATKGLHVAPGDRPTYPSAEGPT